jgi:hypothetical protein
MICCRERVARPFLRPFQASVTIETGNRGWQETNLVFHARQYFETKTGDGAPGGTQQWPSQKNFTTEIVILEV